MKFLIILSALSLVSCGIFRSKNKLAVSGKIEIHHPYCGGAKPTQEMLKGTMEAYKNTSFLVKTQMNNHKKKGTIARFQTDETGAFSVHLPGPGTYFLIHEDKTLSFADFVSKYKVEKQHQSYVGDEMAKKAYEQADAQFEVQEGKDVQIVIRSRCFVGLNPLMKYTGPQPE
ncbi:MAG: hypothetical protein EP338_00610 [Bacteroidetes bacterium]|nr:MAG: hypothetical protein EP338_00610 [Bacteroidota bacterium]